MPPSKVRPQCKAIVPIRLRTCLSSQKKSRAYSYYYWSMCYIYCHAHTCARIIFVHKLHRGFCTLLLQKPLYCSVLWVLLYSFVTREKVCYTLLMMANKPETALYIQGCTFFLWGHTHFVTVYVSVISGHCAVGRCGVPSANPSHSQE